MREDSRAQSRGGYRGGGENLSFSIIHTKTTESAYNLQKYQKITYYILKGFNYSLCKESISFKNFPFFSLSPSTLKK